MSERTVLESTLSLRHPSRLPIAGIGLRVLRDCQECCTSSLATDTLVRLGIHRCTETQSANSGVGCALDCVTARWCSSRSG